MPTIAADFAGAIKGKRTVDSLRDAVSTTLANAKIEASATADKIDANLKTLLELASGHAFLFADTAQIVLKAPDDLTMLVKSRIAEHKAAEEKKEAETRERIRAEEQAKAEKAAREQVEREQREADAKRQLEERLATSQQREDARQAEIAGAVLAVRANAAPQGGQDEFDNWRQGGTAAPFANVGPMGHAPAGCRSTARCAPGRWPGPMPAPVTGSRSRAISESEPRSTRRSRRLPRRTPTRTNRTTTRSSRPFAPGASRPIRCDPPC